MTTLNIPKWELIWLLGCSDLQMGDGDTARKLAERWLNGESAIDIINDKQRMAGLPEISDAEIAP